MNYESDEINLKATELRLGLPGSDEPEKTYIKNNKRASPEISQESKTDSSVSNGENDERESGPPAK